MDVNGPDMFKSIYKILTALEKSLDVEEFDIKLIDHEALKISKTRWIAYMEMLIDEGYIKGYQIKHSIYGETMTSGRPMITLKGMVKTAPGLAFTGYAVQKVELATVEEAWRALFGAEVADR